ncbi:unnamed protein product [Agarophyton chilense]
MPPSPKFAPSSQLLTTCELQRLLRVFRDAGVQRVRFTGGEPLIRADATELVATAAQQLALGVALTTNAVLLTRRRLAALRHAGLSAVNISLDTLCAHSFALLTRRSAATHSRVVAALHDALEEPSLAVKLNVVVMHPFNVAELPRFAALTEHHALDVRFIEYMPFDGNGWRDAAFVPYAHMLQALSRHFGRLQHERTHANDTAKYYRVPNFVGRIGFISSMTEHFCAGCNRLRLTADGALKTCLFGERELSLRDLMRRGASDLDLLHAIRTALLAKHYALGGKSDRFALAAAPNRSMVTIGG